MRNRKNLLVTTEAFFRPIRKRQRQKKKMLERKMKELEKLCDDIDWYEALPDRVIDLAYDIGEPGLLYLRKRMDDGVVSPNLRLEGF